MEKLMNFGVKNSFLVGDIIIPFNGQQGMYYIKDGKKHVICLNEETAGKFMGDNDDISASFTCHEYDGYAKCCLKFCVKNSHSIEVIGLNTGIDCYMESYPEWNDKFFPTMLRCEKTHFWSYFLSPKGKCFALFCTQPIASYSLDYNKGDGFYWGHRIQTVNLELVNGGTLPQRHPRININEGEWVERELYIVPLNSVRDIYCKAWELCEIPLIEIERTALKVGDKISYMMNTQKLNKFNVFSPDGQIFDYSKKVDQPGVYRILFEDVNGKSGEACVSVLNPYEWYMKQARVAALEMPQKATTHAESWYGFYSAFLSKKHYPIPEIDSLLDKSFNEVLPLMFDIKNIEPILIPERIQNTSSLIGVLVDRYEADPQNNKESLLLASKFGDWLMGKQKEDGAYYRNGNLHYTCVIYVAKSMLELSFAEKEIFPQKSKVHYESASRAIENLVELLECIGTEGEHTLEDGMLSCSALQIGMYALTLPQEKREKYIKAAEHMLNIHECLEQNIVPDSRMRGGTMRFWEAQYDVLIKGNMINSPHGWSAWYSYATYYLYLLTGKKEYLIRTINSLGACLQLMSYEGKLRWGFVVDPQINTEIMVPDYTKPLQDGYEHIAALAPAYAGKYENSTIGEQYIDMISGWYRISDEKRVGGYLRCPLFFKDYKEVRSTQGGCCDNDVHEIFKCLEETLLKKAFVIEEEPNIFSGWNCDVELSGNKLVIHSYEETELLHINIRGIKSIEFDGKLVAENINGMKYLQLDLK